MRLFALRGATTVDANDAEAILGATEALMQEILDRNGLRPEDAVSCIFTLTNDLDAEFPAAAARNIGFSAVPLLCAREVAVSRSPPRALFVPVHYHPPQAPQSPPPYPRATPPPPPGPPGGA